MATELSVEKPRLAAIVLAAGLSTRMGGPNKLLMDYRGKPLLRHALDLVASLNLAQRVVVTGRDAEEVSRIVPEGFEIVFNSRFREGMGGSIAAGVRALRREIDGVLIFLGDMPGVQQADVRVVMDAFSAAGRLASVIPAPDQVRGKLAGIQRALAADTALDPGFRRGDDPVTIVVPRHQSQNGHPVLFGRTHFAALADLSGDQGARGIVSSHPHATIEVECSLGVLRDVDSAADF